MSAIRAVLLVKCDQRRRELDAAGDASPVPACIPTGAGWPGSAHDIGDGRW